MTVAAVLEIIKGVLQFPDAVLSLIRILKDTPEESREKILVAMRAEADKFQDTGRPNWDT